jgi:hypothetical protein
MTRKPPTRPSMGQKAQVKHTTTIRKGARGKVVHHEDKTELVDVADIQPGDAKSSAGYDIKYWASDKNHGMTIGASAHVSLTCSQHSNVLALANDVAAELAWTFMHRNAKRAQQHIDKFIDGEGDAQDRR